MQQVAIQQQLLIYDTQAKGGIVFGKDAFDQISWWHDCHNRLVYVKQLFVTLVLQKIRILENKTSQVILQSKYRPTSFQTVFFLF